MEAPWNRLTNTIDLDSPDDVALADRMKGGREQIIAELRKAIVGQDEVVNEVLLTLFIGGNSLIVGVPGLAKTLLVYTLARVLELKFSRIQFTPGPDAVRHHRHRPDPGGSGDRPPPDGVLAGADLREHRARRRDQPHAAEDAVGAARGDAGAPRHDPGAHLSARRAVLRVRDAEPDRARRHVSAARGAARSLHVPHRDRPSAASRRSSRSCVRPRRCAT